MTLNDAIYQALRSVPYPGMSRDVVSFGLVEGVGVNEGQAEVRMAMAHLPEEIQLQVRETVARAVTAVPGVESLTLRIGAPAFAKGATASRPAEPRQLPGVRAVIAVGSGKGGVGKSTIAVNLAVALQRSGLRVGLLDADIHGPNLPRMLGLHELPAGENGRLHPAEAYGMRVMSLGLIAREGEAVIWRGPMVDKVIREFFDRVDWGELDILVVDLPPGTGDAQLALTKRIALDGVIIVSTPQAVALDDATRGLQMFRQMDVPVLGLVENMNVFVCPECYHQTHLFDTGAVRAAASRLAVPLLGEIPIVPALREGGDQGQPAALDPASMAGMLFSGMARNVAAQLEILAAPVA